VPVPRKKLALIHTSPKLIQAFEELCNEHDGQNERDEAKLT